jgi:hypothetical protein
MAIHKLLTDDFEEVDYQLIAIHTVLENYRIAFFINQLLPILLSRNTKDILIETGNQFATFSHFEFNDGKKGIFWSLIENKKELPVAQSTVLSNLFTEKESFTNTFYLLPEFKKAAYLLKIEGEKKQINTDIIIQQLKTIDQVTTVYSVEKSQIKSKNNLIF